MTTHPESSKVVMHGIINLFSKGPAGDLLVRAYVAASKIFANIYHDARLPLHIASLHIGGGSIITVATRMVRHSQGMLHFPIMITVRYIVLFRLAPAR
jgi:hypothetical protein